MAVESK